MSSARPYGAPLHCPKCVTREYYGVLKLQGGPKMIRCPNCNTVLVHVSRRRPKALAALAGPGGVPEGA